jgi:hypothetical protein
MTPAEAAEGLVESLKNGLTKRKQTLKRTEKETKKRRKFARKPCGNDRRKKRRKDRNQRGKPLPARHGVICGRINDFASDRIKRVTSGQLP